MSDASVAPRNLAQKQTKHIEQVYKGAYTQRLAHKYYALATLKFRHRLLYIDILYCLWRGRIKTWYIEQRARRARATFIFGRVMEIGRLWMCCSLFKFWTWFFVSVKRLDFVLNFCTSGNVTNIYYENHYTHENR